MKENSKRKMFLKGPRFPIKNNLETKGMNILKTLMTFKMFRPLKIPIWPIISQETSSIISSK